jgi:hypothetical protein
LADFYGGTSSIQQQTVLVQGYELNEYGLLAAYSALGAMILYIV